MHSSDEILSYEPFSKTWRIRKTKGEIPPRTLGASGVCLENSFYIFGGQHGHPDEKDFVEGNNNEIYELNLKTLAWKKLNFDANISPLPTEKSLMTSHTNFLYIFGGYSESPEDFKFYPIKPKYEHDSSSSYQWPRGWNGSLTRYDLSKNKWEFLKNCPASARAGHAGDKTGTNLWVIFGGRSRSTRLNDVIIYDLNNDTWKVIDPGYQPELLYYLDRDEPLGTVATQDGKKFPEPRSGHSFDFIGEGKFFLYGGIGMLNSPLNDAWILRITSDLQAIWIPYPLDYDHGFGRCLHSSLYFQSSQLLIHSGCTQEFFNHQLDLNDHTETILTFDFGVKSLFQLALEFVEKKFPISDFDLQVPLAIQNTMKCRLKLDNEEIRFRPLIDCEPLFQRSILHSGL